MIAKKSRRRRKPPAPAPLRVNICTYKGSPLYRDALLSTVASIDIPLARAIEEGLNLWITSHGKKPVSGRTEGRYRN